MLRPLSRSRRARRRASTALAFLFVLAFLPPPPPQSAAPRPAKAADGVQNPLIPSIPAGEAYRQTNLISDVPGLAPVLDPLLVNPWGLSEGPATPFWVSNNGTSTTQLIRDPNGAGPVVLNPSRPTVNIEGGLPTGTVANTTADFNITPPGGGTPAPASFIFDSLTGKITAWNAAQGDTARVVVDLQATNHVWTGLAIGSNSGGSRLYAADFELGHVDVFDGSFHPTTVTGGFLDPTVPAAYHPFNIQNLAGSLYVTYARFDPSTHESVNGPGEGYVRKFNTDGVRDLTFAIDQGELDAPWGLAIAPASFGTFGGSLLVGNFSDEGKIHAYNPTTGAPAAADNALKNEAGEDIEIDELWALQFGNGGQGGNPNTLYFTSGLGEEEHGLFGKLDPTTQTATSLIQFAGDSFAIGEGGGHIDITVTRTGDASNTATVNFNTFDESAAGHASQKSDYEIALGKLTFAPGETSKTFRVLVVNDNFVEGDETLELMLSNPTGAGAGLGSPSTAELKLLDNDTTPSTTNPIDTSPFFVRQHYLDFLNREPDPGGAAFWQNEIDSCGSNAACREAKRVSVSAAFFLSIEFQQTGLLAYLTHRAAFGPTAPNTPAPVQYGDFMRDTQALQRGFIFGQPGADAVLEQNKQAYFNEFVTRPEFLARYPASLSNAQYVDALLAAANLRPEDVRLFVVNLTNAQEIPPTHPTTTTGEARPASFGTARFQFNAAQTALSMTATVFNIDITGSQTPDTNDDLTAAHIHAGATVSPTTTGPVVWGFFGNPFNDNNPNDQVFFTLPGGQVGGTFLGKWDAPEGNGTTLAAQLDNLRSGHAYINFHTRQFPGGEIRGNFPAASSFRDSLVAGLNAGDETRATVLRKVAESEELRTREFNAAFVTMEYFGYLRRDPDASGFQFWLNKLNSFNGDFRAAEMVKAFITSSEYRQRFGAS